MENLVHHISKSWNRALVSQLFLTFEVERVMSIPLSSRLPVYTVCWDIEKNGVYSVKSAYKALWGDSNMEHEVFASYTMDLWKKIWRLKVLPQVKIFAWRAVANELPTNFDLQHRLPNHCATCSLCEREDESSLHALYFCSLATELKA